MPFGVQVVDNAVKESIVDQFIGTQAGRRRLAASMVQPLRERRDYSSVGRKTFLVEQLPDGALRCTGDQRQCVLIFTARCSHHPTREVDDLL